MNKKPRFARGGGSMRSFAGRALGAAVACAFAAGAAAQDASRGLKGALPELPALPAVLKDAYPAGPKGALGAIVHYEEAPSGHVRTLEESGGLLVPVAPARENDRREALPPPGSLRFTGVRIEIPVAKPPAAPPGNRPRA
jgi:hypothetical protein